MLWVREILGKRAYMQPPGKKATETFSTSAVPMKQLEKVSFRNSITFPSFLVHLKCDHSACLSDKRFHYAQIAK